MKYLITIMLIGAFSVPTLANDYDAQAAVSVELAKIKLRHRTKVIVTPAPPQVTTVTQGCGCSSGHNCSASFCKANGGGGCPASCPIQKQTIRAGNRTEEVWVTDETGNRVRVLVEGRQDPNVDGAVDQSYPRTFGALPQSKYQLPAAQSGGSCPNGTCGSTQSNGWYLGKRLGR